MNRLIQKETNPDVLRKMLAQCEWDIENSPTNMMMARKSLILAIKTESDLN